MLLNSVDNGGDCNPEKAAEGEPKLPPPRDVLEEHLPQDHVVNLSGRKPDDLSRNEARTEADLEPTNDDHTVNATSTALDTQIPNDKKAATPGMFIILKAYY